MKTNYTQRNQFLVQVREILGGRVQECAANSSKLPVMNKINNTQVSK